MYEGESMRVTGPDLFGIALILTGSESMRLFILAVFVLTPFTIYTVSHHNPITDQHVSVLCL